MSSSIKKALKITAIGILVIIAGAIATGCALHRSLPEGDQPEKADRLAHKMLRAIHFEAWDSTRYVAWSFNGLNAYVWDKKENLVYMKSGKKEVIFNTKTRKGSAYRKGEQLEAKKEKKAINDAIEHFNNDSFWLNAPAKVFDPGTKRIIPEGHEEENALLVTYTSGGTTPGDSYLWLLDEDGVPSHFRMWVSVIPIGGVKASWKDWKETNTGALIAQKRGFGIVKLKLDYVKTGQTCKAIGVQNPFKERRL